MVGCCVCVLLLFVRVTGGRLCVCVLLFVRVTGGRLLCVCATAVCQSNWW